MRIAYIVPLWCALLFTCVALVGCGSNKTVGADQPELPEPEDGDYADAIRLNNGTVKLIIVPSLGGRIMRYGFVGEGNVLWNNPQAQQLREQAATRPTMNVNYGGDKAWPWPQDQWPLLLGRSYPPPAEADQAPYKSRLIGSHGVRLESPPIPSHGARIVREIKLDGQGTRVTIVTRLEPIASSEHQPPPELAAWSVTQVPGFAKMYARLLPDGVARAMEPAARPAATRPVMGRVIAIEPPVPHAAKLGLDADLLAIASGKTLFVQHSASAAAPVNVAGYRRAERAQLFVQQADPPRRDVPRYVELEFTSPRRDLAAGQMPELRVTWQLVEASQPWTEKAIGAYLQGDLPAEPANRGLPIDVP